MKSFVLIGDVSIDRSKNTPVTNFMLQENQEVNINNQIVTVDQLGCLANKNNQNLRVKLVMRMDFLVNTFINMYLVDPKD